MRQDRLANRLTEVDFFAGTVIQKLLNTDYPYLSIAVCTMK